MKKTREHNKKILFSVTKKDFILQTFRSGGKGGQHQNTCDSGVRIIHPESGAIGESRNERSQWQNRKLALHRLIKTAQWKIWINKKIFEINNSIHEIERELDSQMANNIKIEIRKNNKWICDNAC
jgi:protein subunit release factor B